MYFFERRVGLEHWEPIGVGEASGPRPFQTALKGLSQQLREGLPAGEYRCFASVDSSARWQYLALSEDGQVAVWAQS